MPAKGAEEKIKRPDASLPAHLGRYDVLGFLAAGGMAEVLLGRLRGPAGFEHPVVLKRSLPHLARQPAFVEMFMEEARNIARIRHPNVVGVYELVHDDAADNNNLFLVMEYLAGESAAGLQRRLKTMNEMLDLDIAIHIVAECCAGLHAAHELRDDDDSPLQLVHRDISPENIFITYDGAVKVIDFGIAKAHDSVARTALGELRGKLEYMSPEQYRGEELDRRSDIFALGVVLYELSTRRRLFKRATAPATMNAVLNEVVLPPSRIVPDYPTELERICLRALARDRRDRYETALDLRRDLLTACRQPSSSSSTSDRLPEEALASLMARLFAERRAEKLEMLRRFKDGSVPTTMPAQEVDEQVDLEIAVEVGTELIAPASSGNAPLATLATPTTVLQPPRGSSRAPLSTAAGAPSKGRRIGVIVGAILGSIVLLGAVTIGATSRSTAPPLKPLSNGSSTTATQGDEAPNGGVTEVQIQIESSPHGAEVRVNGSLVGTTPLSKRWPKGDEPILVELKKDGFVLAKESIKPSVEQRIHVQLQPARTAGATRPVVIPHPKPASASSSSGFRKW